MRIDTRWNQNQIYYWNKPVYPGHYDSFTQKAKQRREPPFPQNPVQHPASTLSLSLNLGTHRIPTCDGRRMFRMFVRGAIRAHE